MKTAALIDYDRGNLRSVEKALERVGCAVRLVADGPSLASAEADLCVLPGVGAFGDAMARLTERGLVAPLRQWLSEDRPFLGICLGFQLLFESSEESPGVSGLGVLNGTVRRFDSSVGKVPHMGWNQVRWTSNHRKDDSLADNVARAMTHPHEGGYFYHVHSYYAPEIVAAPSIGGIGLTEYGHNFTSGLVRGRMAGFQFHPEKSQAAGLRLLAAVVDALKTSP